MNENVEDLPDEEEENEISRPSVNKAFQCLSGLERFFEVYKLWQNGIMYFSKYCFQTQKSSIFFNI